MLNKKTVITIMLVSFLGTIVVANLLGFWSMSVEEGVSGDTLLIEVSKKYQIPLEEIYAYWKIPSNVSPRATVSEAKAVAGFSTGQFKAWVAARTAVPELKQVEEVVTSELTLEIKGSTTLQQISDTYKIPLDVIFTKWKLSKMISPNTPLKELKDGYGFTMEEFKAWVAETRKK